MADALGATVLRSDELRKELAGLPATQRAPAAFGEGLYRLEATAATYGEMLARAGVALGLGESVVLDASWTAEPWRARARELAGRRQADLVEIRCRTDAARAERRIRRRLATGGDASDATPLIAAKLAAAEDPWPGAIDLETSCGPGETLVQALARIAPRPALSGCR